MRHGGRVMAPDAELAVHYAREMYSRRQESVRLWVVRRADIHDLEDPDLLQPPMDRSFKKPGGYVMRDKLAAARERSGTASPKAKAEVTMSLAALVADDSRAVLRRAAPTGSSPLRWPTTSSSSASPTRSGPASHRCSRKTSR